MSINKKEIPLFKKIKSMSKLNSESIEKSELTKSNNS